MKELHMKVPKTDFCPFCGFEWIQVCLRDNIMFCKNCGEIEVYDEKTKSNRKSK